MAVQLISRPIGHKLDINQHEGQAFDQAGDVVIYVPGGHQLTDGQYVYIESNIEAYNGYRYVDSVAYDHFKIKGSEDGDFIVFYQEVDVTFYVSVLDHGWQCVHLPIPYELQSDLWPNNIAEEEYTPNLIDSFQQRNGYVQINLDRAIDNLEELNFLELIPPDLSYTIQGPYQILEVVAPWAMVINLAYNASFDFTGYSVVNYYNNYNINVEVWAGLESGHRWESLKPFELAATLKFIPDSQGKIKFSIHEVLKSYIRTRNHLTLETLPNNLDFHVSFYIKYYESYDLSDGDEVATEIGDVTTDDFVGHAVNAMLPFKSANSGFMSDYVNEGDTLARWLTLFPRPVAVIGYFFDLSFILKDVGFDVQVTIYKSSLGVVTDTEVITIGNPGSGIIRVPFTPQSGFDEYCIQAAGSGSPVVSLSSFINRVGAGTDWTTGANPSVTLNTGSANSLYRLFSFVEGITYSISATYTYSTANTFTVSLSVRDSSFVSSESDTNAHLTGSGSGTLSISFEALGTDDRIVFFAGSLMGGDTTVTITSISIQVEPFNITEQICINIIEECGSTLTNDNLRLLEGGPFRELE